MTQKVGGVEFDVTVGVDGAIVASKKIISNNEAVENSFKDIDRASKSASDTMVKGGNAASKATSNMSRNIGMGAVQVGQLAGQIQGGQSALLAFSQQGADIGMLFGPTGMVVGGILAVASALAGAFIPGLLDSGNATDDLAEKLRELQKENQLTENQLAFLAQEEAKAEKVKKEKVKTIAEEISETEKMISQLSALRAAEIKAGKATEVNKTIVGGYTESIRKLKEELTELKASLETETVTPTPKVDKKAMEEAMRQANSRLETVSAALSAESDLYSAHAQNRINIEKGIYSEAEAAAVEADIAAQNRISMQYQQLTQALEQEKTAILENKNLTAEQKKEITDQYDALELEADANHKKAMEKQQEDHSKKMIAIKEMEESAKRKAVAGAFGDISQLMNTESRKLFEIGKAAALAQAVVTGYDAAVTNYKKGSEIGGPPVGAAFAAASLAATFAQIKAIQSTQFGSAGGGQSIQGGQVSNNVNGGGVGPSQGSRQDISISVTGGDDAGRSLLGLINMTLADGGKIGG